MTSWGDLNPTAFRSEAHRLVDWISCYLEGAERYPVLSRVRPGEIRDALPSAPPPGGEPLEAILADVERVIVPGLTHWNHPGFFAYFANSSPGPAVLAEALAAAFNANAMLWKTAPAATELELVVLDWLRQMLGLPAGLFGVIQDTASTSTLVALAAAREAVPGLDVRRRGLVGQARLRMYASEQAHSSVEKAGIVLGIGQPASRRSPSPPRWGRHPRPASTRCRRSPTCARGSVCGSTWTPPTREAPRWCRSCAGCSRGASGPTRSS
jgi:aromatic-L-amino-acid decarboxylase